MDLRQEHLQHLQVNINNFIFCENHFLCNISKA
jgi:hypothetical protein